MSKPFISPDATPEEEEARIGEFLALPFEERASIYFSALERMRNEGLI